jgi:hypothetical protein
MKKTKKLKTILSAKIAASIFPVIVNAQWGSNPLQNTDISRDGNVGIGFLHSSPLSGKLTIA